MRSRPWNKRLLPGALAAAVVALGFWVVANTEWVGIDIPRPASGRAAGDPMYALQHILQGIGASTVRRDSLTELPPSGATLVLNAWIWRVFPEQDRALRRWVEQGGHLVIGAWLIFGRRDDAADWIPVELARRVVTQEPPTAEPQPEQPKRAPGAGVPLTKEPCRQLAEPAGVTPAYSGDGAADGGARSLELCALGPTPLAARQAPLWALEGDGGIELVRVAVGSGSVTVVPAWSIFENRRILQGDDALIAVAALQARPGAKVWLVSGNGEGGILEWLWRRGSIAVELGLLALAIWLWRAGVRFGPMQASSSSARRSMNEQIAGTAIFLWRCSPGALHAAQLRALDEVATLQLRDYARLDRHGRAAAISKSTGLDVAAVTKAVDFGAAPSARALPRMLAVLEMARRSLLERAGAQRAAVHLDRTAHRFESHTEGA